MKDSVIYISGPMTGYTDHNFPAFYAAEKVLLEMGFTIVNPADNGRDPTTTWEDFLRRDLLNMLDASEPCTALCVLDGWRESKGAQLEVYVAKQLSLPIYKLHKILEHDDAYVLVEESESVIKEADRIINGPRQEFYGHPIDNMRKTAGIINAMFEDKLKAKFTEEDITLLMMGVKLARQVHRPQRDNIVDIIGYAGCHEKVEIERKKRDASYDQW